MIIVCVLQHAVHLRAGVKFGDVSMEDTMLKDGLTDAFHNYHMGITAENIADKYGLTRDEQDAFAADPVRLAVLDRPRVEPEQPPRLLVDVDRDVGRGLLACVLLVDRTFAATLEDGAVSLLDYVDRVRLIPQTLFDGTLLGAAYSQFPK